MEGASIELLWRQTCVRARSKWYVALLRPGRERVAEVMPMEIRNSRVLNGHLEPEAQLGLQFTN